MQIKLLAVFAFVLLALVFLLSRITYITATRGNQYAKQVLSQQSYDSQSIPYRRGEILDRNGIILAKNQLAKQYNIQTAETIWQAKHKCPGLVCVLAHHGYYGEISQKINQIYLAYTDLTEPASIDESYLDVTNTLHLFGKSPPGAGGRDAADLPGMLPRDL